MAPTIADRLKWMLAELDDLDRAPTSDVVIHRTAALYKQIEDTIEVLRERRLI